MLVASGHAMPFGAELRGDGRVRFRLWAPAAASVHLELLDRGQRLPMRRRQAGLARALTEAAAGERYRFVCRTGRAVADPASRCQAEDADGPSLIVDPDAYAGAATPGRDGPGARP